MADSPTHPQEPDQNQEIAPNQDQGLNGTKSEEQIAVLEGGINEIVDAINEQSNLIKKPDAGETVFINADDLERLEFAFSLDGVAVNLNDVDLIITFEDGARIVLVN